MARLAAIDPKQATGRAKELLDAVHAKLGITPNMMRTMAASPVVLEGYLGLSGALAGGRLPAKFREAIALAVAQVNGCDYCLAAHAALGRLAKLSEREIAQSRRHASDDPRTAAALDFAAALAMGHGDARDATFARVHDAGWSDGEIAEIIAAVALNVFTNYFNEAAGVAVDFPLRRLSDARPPEDFHLLRRAGYEESPP